MGSIAVGAALVSLALVVRLQGEVEALREEVTRLQPPPGDSGAAPPPPQPALFVERQCNGQIAQDMARLVAGQHHAEVLECVHDGSEVVALQLEVTVEEDGHVSTARGAAEPPDAEVARCAEAVAATWRFPPPVGGDCAIVTAPFLLQPEAEPQRPEG